MASSSTPGFIAVLRTIRSLFSRAISSACLGLYLAVFVLLRFNSREMVDAERFFSGRGLPEDMAAS